jgi:CBS domain-containing protein
MKAVEIMTRNPVTVGPEASIMKAVGLMLQRRISGLPVVDRGGALVGIVTEGDLLRRTETGTQRHRPRWLEFLIGPGHLADEYVQACGRKIHEVMTQNVVTIAEDTPMDEIVHIIESRRIRRLPVLREGRLVGIVSRANLVRALASLARETRPSPVDDAAIQRHLLAELEKQPWAPVALINVIVRNGAVHLWGALTDERERRGIRVAAENTPGVKCVVDHLVWVEPASGFVLPPPDEEASEDAPTVQPRGIERTA